MTSDAPDCGAAYDAGVAAERERIRQLATRHMTISSKCAAGLAVHPSCRCAAANPAFPFADLIPRPEATLG